ncbi:MBL fold metallo-hydrolase [Ruminococcaceae bacterium OttesenSCG-928-O06]|nr:MBL fold metallo-hydrolase [Ruminococcaceae bacterium OttesenSCG-928-O06]
MDEMKRGGYTVHKVYDDVYAIDEERVRSYLFLGENEALLVDAGVSGEDMRALVKELTALPVRLVVTHCDGDHIASAHQFEACYMHPAEFSLLYSKNDTQLAPKVIREGEVIDLGTRRFAVLLIPGHTPGSIALWDEENRLLVAGDTLGTVPVWMFGPGRNLAAYIDSLGRLLALGGGVQTVLASHGPALVDAGIIAELHTAAQLLQVGQLTGQDDGSGLPCLLYRHARAKLYY